MEGKPGALGKFYTVHNLTRSLKKFCVYLSLAVFFFFFSQSLDRARPRCASCADQLAISRS
jgi:hypothetical protein